MFTFSKKSKQRLESCNKDIQSVMNVSIQRSSVDFGIAEGHRSIKRQNELYKSAASQLDGIVNKSKHNYNPSMAVDIYAYVKGKRTLSYDFNHLSFIAGVVMSVCDELHESGVISHKMVWGGNWDRDGEIITDQRFDDLVHFELV